MTAPKRKGIARQVAEHLGCDIAELRDYEYHPGCWSRKVFSGMDGNNYWSGSGKNPPAYRDGSDDDITWKRVPSNFPGNPDLWVGK